MCNKFIFKWSNFKYAPILIFNFLYISEIYGQPYIVTNMADAGAGSLRQAITDANGNAGADIINFNIGGAAPFTINILTKLPTIADAVTIDGTTQSGYIGAPIIELNGTSASMSNGLNITAGNSTIRGLVINRFS